MPALPLADLVGTLSTSAGALAVLGAAIDARLSGAPLDLPLRTHVDGIVDALGVRQSLDSASPTELRALLGEIRSVSHVHAKLLYPAGRRPGWSHTETELLQATGDATCGFAQLLHETLAPQLDGLAERLARPGAAFLDIGAGVARLAIEMATSHPKLRVVGLEPWGPSLELARENVTAAGLQGRVEIREQAGEDVAVSESYDLAWIPGAFLPGRVIPILVARVLRALRPGGWLLFALPSTSDDALATALARFRTVMFGGEPVSAPEVEAQLAHAGFVETRTLSVRVGTLVAARRPG
jgi:precorrin-6B methylase 2